MKEKLLKIKTIVKCHDSVRTRCGKLMILNQLFKWWIGPKCYYLARKYLAYLKIVNRDMENQNPIEGMKKKKLFIFLIHFKIVCFEVCLWSFLLIQSHKRSFLLLFVVKVTYKRLREVSESEKGPILPPPPLKSRERWRNDGSA